MKAIAGEVKRQQEKESDHRWRVSDHRWRGATAGGRERSHVEWSDRGWREAIAGRSRRQWFRVDE
jgi:hypothetical protein